MVLSSVSDLNTGRRLEKFTNVMQGIATRYDIKAYPIGKVWGGFRLYDGGKADDIYSALHNFVPGNADDDKAAIILTDVIALGSARLFLIFYYYEGEEPPTTGPLAQFLNIGSILDTTKTQSYSELVSGNLELSQHPVDLLILP